MEYSTRQNATVRLANNTLVLFVLMLFVLLPACTPDDAPKEGPKVSNVSKSNSEGTVIDEKGVPSMINGKRVKSVQQVDGGIEPYDGDDPSGDGQDLAIKEVTATITGFAGISPCDVIKTTDLKGWPGGIGPASSARSNMGEVVLGCITTFKASGNNPAGSISVYFSDNQTPEKAAESIQLMPNTSKGNAKLITDWEKPAAYDYSTGEFAWAHNQVFMTLLIAHPSVKEDNLEWSKKIASAIESRMP